MVTQYAGRQQFLHVWRSRRDATQARRAQGSLRTPWARDYDEISKDDFRSYVHSVSQRQSSLNKLADMAAMGFDHVIFNVINDFEGKPIAQLGAETLPAIAEL